MFLWANVLPVSGHGRKAAFTKKVSDSEHLQLFALKSIREGFKLVYVIV